MELKLGRKHALFPAGLRDLTYYAPGPLPAAPATVAVPSVSTWGMLGNDRYGDCGVAGLDHGFMAVDASLSQPPLAVTDQQAVDYYMTYGNGQDNGVVLSQYLAYVQQTGYYGRSVSLYAPVNVQDVNTLHFAIDAYDFVYTGIQVMQAMQEAFGDGSNPQPWTLENVSGPVAGGHCIPLVGYDSQYLYAITWGAVQPIAYPAWARIAEEAWAVLTGEITTTGDDGHGLNLAALQADINQLAS